MGQLEGLTSERLVAYGRPVTGAAPPAEPLDASSPLVVGPGWTDQGYTVVRGRFPLAVERYVMAMVADLVPGVTTVTLNARYYSLHAWVASSAAAEGLTDSQAVERLRRAEVVLGAVSARHLELSPATHAAYSQPHGYNRIVPAVRAGAVDLAALAQPGSYATSRQGFMGAYRGSEILLRIVPDEGRLRVGEHLDPAAMTDLQVLRGLVDRDMLDQQLLDEHADLCLCRMPESADGAWLAALFAARERDEPSARVRRRTLQLLRQAFKQAKVTDVTTDLRAWLCYSPEGQEQARTQVPDLWRGLMLRNRTTTAWRELWAWLVDEVGTLSTRNRLGDRFASEMPSSTVHLWMESLPATKEAGRLIDAESLVHEQERTGPERQLAVLALGAQRAGELEGDVFRGFTARRPDDRYEELSPLWLQDQLLTWRDRPLADFARHLTHLLVNRSQRLALAKARPDRTTGWIQVPTRLLTRDEYLFTHGSEGRGSASLRLGQLARITAGTGLFDGNGDRWAAGSRAELLDD